MASQHVQRGCACATTEGISWQFHPNNCLSRQLGGLAAFLWISLGGLQGGSHGQTCFVVTVPCSPLLGSFPTLDPSTSLQVCVWKCSLHAAALGRSHGSCRTVLTPSRFITCAAVLQSGDP